MVTRNPRVVVYTGCPECHSPQAILAFEHYGLKSYFCPDCDHEWDVRNIPAESASGAKAAKPNGRRS